MADQSKTVRLDDDLHQAAKIEAAKKNQSLQELINDLLRAALGLKKKK